MKLNRSLKAAFFVPGHLLMDLIWDGKELAIWRHETPYRRKMVVYSLVNLLVYGIVLFLLSSWWESDRLLTYGLVIVILTQLVFFFVR